MQNISISNKLYCLKCVCIKESIEEKCVNDSKNLLNTSTVFNIDSKYKKCYYIFKICYVKL